MRILMLVHNTAWGSGTYFRAFGLASAIVRRGHEVSLVAAGRVRQSRSTTSMHAGVEVVQPASVLPFRIRHGGFSPIDLLSRLRWVRSRQFDLVHGFEHRPAVLIPALTIRARQGIPYIHDWADIWGWRGIANQRSWPGKLLLGIPDMLLERRVPFWADGVTVVNNYLKLKLIADGLDPERISLVPPGSGPILPDEIEVERARAEWGLPLDAPVLAHVGISHYDDPFVLAVWEQLRSNHAQAILVLAGDPSMQALRALESETASGRVRFLGLLDHRSIHSLLSSADVLLLPFTDREINRGRFPNRIGDYLTAARPIVTNMTGDLGHLVEEHEVGLALEDNVQEFARQVTSLLEDVHRRERYGRRARQLAETDMNWDRHAERLEELYGRVIGGQGRV